MRRTPPQSSFDSATARTFRRKRYLPGVCALFAISQQCVHSRGGSRVPASSVLRQSQPLDGLLRSAARRLVSSDNRVQDCPVQGFGHSTQDPTSSAGLSPLPFRPKHSPTNRCPRSTPADFEDLLHVKPRFTGSVVKPNQRTRPSSGLVLLQAISQPLPRLTRRQALMTFSDERVTTQAQSLARRFASSVFAARSLTISPR
jgi:hypothetical protein